MLKTYTIILSTIEFIIIGNNSCVMPKIIIYLFRKLEKIVLQLAYSCVQKRKKMSNIDKNH